MLAENEPSEERDDSVGQRGGRTDEAIVGPGKRERPRDKEGDEGSDTEPDRECGKDGEGGVEEHGERPEGERADVLHAAAEQDVAQGPGQNHDEDHEEGLQVQGLVRGSRCGRLAGELRGHMTIVSKQTGATRGATGGVRDRQSVAGTMGYGRMMSAFSCGAGEGWRRRNDGVGREVL